MGGVIISPRGTKLHCAYAADGSTQGSYKTCVGREASCIPGCYVDGNAFWCHDRREHPSCPWPPDKLDQAMLHNEEMRPDLYK